MRVIRATGLAALLSLLVACAAQPPAVPLEPWQIRSEQLAAVGEWQARGRLSLTTPGDSVQGSFEWRQRPDWVEIRFRGPVGLGGLFVYGPPGQLTAIGRDGERTVLGDPEVDLAAVFGFGLPVQSLPYWLLGMADSRYRHAWVFDEFGRPDSLRQRGWQLHYTGWRELGGELLPRRVDLAGEELAIRIVLDRWSPGLDEP
ncbi:MAG: outer membrane lipoprotein LolB [Gammaproteobacteria bacterium]|nr:outer membrane lipoprotein LolB [Gammaproteobacteria bacterium]TVQ44872.1 MAG: outer membrane lipoprotein LolB [Gammaproteobacteria bacterium]